METCGRGSSEREQRIVGSMEDLGIERGIGGRNLRIVGEKGGLWEGIGNFESKQSFVGEKET